MVSPLNKLGLMPISGKQYVVYQAQILQKSGNVGLARTNVTLRKVTSLIGLRLFSLYYWEFT